ncbi:hypothetical protein CBER1_11606 [Cercospora berteroae]|uniref:Uncharacterized protein n=1 Tax=Cercospora berteroae TaxID=357750 RepID=A0A2S6C037_9PEZI|nr:hypothetical protein CBER1_11606 [Cercospora berteroae]
MRKQVLLPSTNVLNGTVVLICILCSAAQNVVRHHPSSIATIAIVLASSTDIQKLPVRAGPSRTKKPQVWVPLSARHYMMCLTVGAPLVAIVILEILFTISDRNQGVTDVTNTEDTATYLSCYLSALVMFAIATSFNGLDFTLSSFAPYSLLRSGSVPAARGIGFHILGSYPLLALCKSLRVKHWASALSNSAGILGGFLTVISSGLWVVGRNVVLSRAVQVPLAHTWNATWHNSPQVGDSGAAVTLDMIQKGGATTGPLVWNDHVLPALGTEVTMSGELPAYVTGSSSFNYTFEINALRPYLECEPVSEENISTAVFADNSPQNFINVSFPLKGLCQKGGRNGTNAYFEVSYSMILSKEREWTGKLLDLHLGPFFDRTVFTESSAYNVTEKMLEYGEPSWGPDNMMGCPSIGVIIGEFVEEVQLSVTYHGNQTNTPALIGASAPRPKPGQSRFLTNGTDGFDAFPYRMQTYIGVYDYGGGRGNLSAFSAGRGEFSDWIDSFADNIVNGPDGVPYEELRGKANQDNLIRATQKLYNKYMTLVIDANFRQSLSNPQDHPIVTGRLEVLSSRLHVNFVSKMILQVVFASMIIMGSFAFWLADLRETLPRKPTSIASTMAFRAGSDLCGSAGSPPLIPPNALQMNSAEVARVFDGWFSSLGWWSKSRKAGSNGSEGMMTDKQEEERRFGIDVGVPDRLGFRRRRNVFRRK